MSYKQYESQGWSKMREVLDKEMPVEKKKRRFVWLFFLLPLLAGGGAWLYHSNLVAKNATTQQPIIHDAEKVIPNNPNIAQAPIESPKKAEDNGINSQINRAENDVTQSTKTITERKKQPKPQAVRLNRSSLKQERLAQMDHQATQVSKDQATVTGSDIDVESQNAVSIQPASLRPILEFQKLSPQWSAVDLKPIELGSHARVLENKLRKGHWGLEAMAAGGLIPSNTIVKYSLGARFYKSFSSDWQIGLSSQFAKINAFKTIEEEQFSASQRIQQNLVFADHGFLAALDFQIPLSSSIYLQTDIGYHGQFRPNKQLESIEVLEDMDSPSTEPSTALDPELSESFEKSTYLFNSGYTQLGLVYKTGKLGFGMHGRYYLNAPNPAMDASQWSINLGIRYRMVP